MDLKQPLVSVIMPAYNAEKYIEKAIMSVVNQTYTNWELIVIDDGSKDSTSEIVEKLVKKDERIAFFANEKNMGVARTRNRGFDLAKGEYVALLDSDDIWLEEKLEKQLALFSETDADIVYTSYGIIDVEDKKYKEDYLVPSQTDFEKMLGENHIGCSTVVLKKNVTEKYRFNENFYHEDYVLWMQLLKDGHKAYGLTEVLVQYRFYPGSRAANKIKSAQKRWIIYREYLDLPFVKSVVCLVNYMLAGIKKYF